MNDPGVLPLSDGCLDDERLARLELSLMAEPGSSSVLALLVEELGGRETVERIRHRDGSLVRVPPAWPAGLTPELTARAAALLSTQHPGAPRWMCPGDAEWPQRLTDLAHAEDLQGLGGPPLGLWVRGQAGLSGVVDSAVAVVGARAATSYGIQVAGDVAADCAARDITVVSGAAFGIDSAAHRGALAMRGTTVAVLACGADVAYPRAHTALIDRIADEGLVVSELAPGSTPTKLRFLARNRLIAALSCGAVVVEAARRSGSLNTLNWSSRLGRVTMGVPGPVTSSSSAGVHALIRDGGALLVTGGDEVAEAVAPMGSQILADVRGEHRAGDDLDPTTRDVLEAVPARGARGIASIAASAGADIDTAMAVLGRLLLGGVVERTGDGWRLTRQAAAAMKTR